MTTLTPELEELFAKDKLIADPLMREALLKLDVAVKGIAEGLKHHPRQRTIVGMILSAMTANILTVNACLFAGERDQMLQPFIDNEIEMLQTQVPFLAKKALEFVSDNFPHTAH